MTRYILWIELKGFYAPESELPQVVIRDKVVLDANSSARKLSIEPGMDIPQVRNLCPECKQIPWKEEAYREAQHRWLDICADFTGILEPCDGHIAALDLTGHPNPADIAEKVISSLTKEVGLPLSYGAGSSKWIACLASEKHELSKGVLDPPSFVSEFDVNRLPIEAKQQERLRFLGYRTIGEVSDLPLEVLREQFGDEGLRIHQSARGGIYQAVNPLYPSEVIRECFIFEAPIEDETTIDQTLLKLAYRFSRRLSGLQASELELSTLWENEKAVKTHRRFTRPIFNQPTVAYALRALNSGRDPANGGMIGITATLHGVKPIKLKQDHFFEVKDRSYVDSAVSSLKNVFGEGAVIMGGQMKIPRRELVLREWKNGTGWR